MKSGSRNHFVIVVVVVVIVVVVVVYVVVLLVAVGFYFFKPRVGFMIWPLGGVVVHFQKFNEEHSSS